MPAAVERIRRAGDDDRTAVTKLWRDGGFGDTPDIEWRAAVEGKTVQLLVAEDGGEVVGTAVTSFDGWRAFIFHVAVAPSHRRRGVARMLLEDAEKRLQEAGARRCFALVNTEQPAGLALCATGGYLAEGYLAFVKELA
jgi:ribosomal protein S18 acetylase RimI-like enzyme